MHIQNSYTFDAPPKAVWDLLVDIDAVAACLPGCESMEPISENKYRAVLTMGIAAITGRYEGTVEMRDLDPPSSYRLVVEGRGKQGFVTGGDHMDPNSLSMNVNEGIVWKKNARTSLLF